MIVVFTAIRKWWHARLRRIDMDILWPVCLKETNDLDHAKAAFALHCYLDPAWRELGEDGIFNFIDRLDACASKPRIYARRTLRRTRTRETRE